MTASRLVNAASKSIRVDILASSVIVLDLK